MLMATFGFLAEERPVVFDRRVINTLSENRG